MKRCTVCGAKRGALVVFIGLAGTVLFLACPSGNKSEAIARVNNDVLTKAEFSALIPEGFDVTQENLPKILDKWVSSELMYQEAVRRGLDKEEEIGTALKRLEREYLVNELLERLTSAVSASEPEILEYFTAHKDEWSYEVKIMRILMGDSVFAAQTRQEIEAGADFKKLARERSQDPLLGGGQESNYFGRGRGDPNIEEAIFGLEPGQVTGVIPGQEGYQIVKLVDKKKVKAEPSIAEVKDYIQAIISLRKSQKLVDSTLSSLRASAKIEISPDVYFK